MVKLDHDKEKANKVREIVSEDERVANIKASERQAIKDDALNEASPALEAANNALNTLDKADISELRVFTTPPEMVQKVLEAVCILLGQETDWKTA